MITTSVSDTGRFPPLPAKSWRELERPNSVGKFYEVLIAVTESTNGKC